MPEIVIVRGAIHGALNPASSAVQRTKSISKFCPGGHIID